MVSMDPQQKNSLVVIPRCTRPPRLRTANYSPRTNTSTLLEKLINVIPAHSLIKPNTGEHCQRWADGRQSRLAMMINCSDNFAQLYPECRGIFLRQWHHSRRIQGTRSLFIKKVNTPLSYSSFYL